MSDAIVTVKGPRRAALKNVGSLYALVTSLLDRPADMDRLGVFYGPSGFGKTFASIYARNKTRGRLIEADVTWDRKSLLRAILTECGVPDVRGTIAQLTRMAIDALGDDPTRPLIVDEADTLVDRGMIEIIRAIHDKARVPVILIGEERLPDKLVATERVHNRVLIWEPAQPCDLEDCRKLADVFLPGVGIDDALLDRVRTEARGAARRVVVTLTNMQDYARNAGLRALTVENYNGGFFNGLAPRRVLPSSTVAGR